MPNKILWQKMSLNISENQINVIASDPQNPAIIFLGTPKALYLSKDYGKRFRQVLSIPSGQRGIKKIVIRAGAGNEVFAVSDLAVYRSKDAGSRWEKIFTGRGAESQCFSVVADQNFVYVGTAEGLFYSERKKWVWQNFSGELGNSAIYDLALGGNTVYAVTSSRVYRIDEEDESAEKIFTLSESESDDEIIADEEYFYAPNRKIKDFVVDTDAPDGMVVSADNGIFVSADSGTNWLPLSTQGLSSKNITSIALIPGLVFGEARLEKDKLSTTDSHGTAAIEGGKGAAGGETASGPALFAGTTDGVFVRQNNSWLAVYQGMDAVHVEKLAVNSPGAVYAATNRGAFYLSPDNVQSALKSSEKNLALDPRQYQEAQKLFRAEPTIRDVHNWAIEYAEVDANKIKSWRRAAKHKGIMPKVSVGLDRSATEMYHWDTTPNPDQLMKGRDYMDWGVSMSWDLGELVWNPDQTSIDSRSKMMVELREDVLDQVTRLYFERRRLQLELLQPDLLDAQGQTANEMRIEELTALIDGFTGGEFSRRVDGRMQSGIRQ